MALPFESLVEVMGYHGAMLLKNLVILVSGIIIGAWVQTAITYFIIKDSRVDPELHSVDFVVIEKNGKRRFIWNPRAFRDFAVNVFIAFLYFVGLIRGVRLTTSGRILSWVLLFILSGVTIFGILLALAVYYDS